VFAVTWFLSYAMTRATSSAFAARYTMTMFPLQLILAAAGALVFVPRRLLAVLTVAVWLAGTAVSISQIDEQRTRAPRFADVLESESDAADVVVYCPDQLGPPLSRLLDQRGVDLDGQFVFPTFGASDRVDWIDYRERHERASTTAFATEAVRRADGHAIWLVVSVTHRPTEAACAGLIDALRALRPEFEVGVPDDPSWREHDYLLRFDVLEPAAAP
jgi:mannosyltransferase